MPRWVITVMLLVGAGLLVLALTSNISNPPATPGEKAAEKPAEKGPATGEKPTIPGETEPSAPATAPESKTPATELKPVEGLHVVVVEEKQPEPVIGSDLHDFKVNPYAMSVKLTPWGGGIIEAKLSRFSTDVSSPAKPESFVPYIVQRQVTSGNVTVYPMAAQSVTVNGVAVPVDVKRWRVTAQDKESATFELVLADGENKPVLKITRRWSLAAGEAGNEEVPYPVRVEQKIENLSGAEVEVVFSQYGPLDLTADRGYMGDVRHAVIGYAQPRASGKVSDIKSNDFYLPRAKLLEADTPAQVWPPTEGDPKRALVWAAMTNRYFTAAVHAPVEATATKAPELQGTFPTVKKLVWGAGSAADQGLGFVLQSGSLRLAAAESKSLDVQLYAGPKDPKVLEAIPANKAMGLGQVIVYNLGGCCSPCTFAWLAEGLLGFLRLIHTVVSDWGVAIIFLVVVVRLILHPLTKSSQVNMMKLSKQMQTLQPELERLKAKFGDNKERLNQETLALYREKGVNPAAMGLGCLPMFLQMPIWMALYAMLYFAIELRHESAFWGVFQSVSGGGWHFLADLSSADRFIVFPEIDLWLFKLSSINILPLLMGVVFFIQQKYMTPPNPNMSPEMKQQQVMMKWMTTLMFPLMLYPAASGLTLYILTSTAVGIWESKRVRKHVNELESSGKLHEKKPVKPGGLMDRLHKALEARQKMMRDQQDGRGGGGGKKRY